MSKIVLSQQYNELVSGSKSLLFADMQKALDKSAQVTTNPAVLTVQVPNSPGSPTTNPFYLACGDHWIGRNNERGRYYYGRRNQLVEVTYA